MAKAMTAEQKARQSVMDQLDQLGNISIGEDSLIFDGTKFIFPKSMEGDYEGIIRYLRSHMEQQETEFNFVKTFNYRPWDGANAFQRAMMRLFGTTGIGGEIQTFFGPIKPEYKTVNVGPTETIQIPWNKVDFAPLRASFYLDSTRTREYGTVFQITVEAPKKHRRRIEAFFQIMEDELKTNSIYRGKAFTGGREPLFLDTAAVDPEKVVYSEDVKVQLDTQVWSVMKHSESMRENGISLKRAVLVEGPYGTGKTLAGMLTAQQAVENGWTFIIARPGDEDLTDVLKTAQLYAPAVVWFEDIDTIAEGDSKMQVSGLLDALDGITNKGKEVVAGFTTNFVQKIQKGVMRPGRLDAIIHVGELDASGFEKLIKVTLGDLLGEVDFIKVAEAFDGFLPAFAKSAIDRAKMYSISRNQGSPGKIDTSDLVHAANGLRPQLDLMNGAKEGVVRPSVDTALLSVVTEVVNQAQLVSASNGERQGLKLAVTNGNKK